MTTQPDPQPVPELLEQCARAIFQLGYINWDRSEEYARACLAAIPALPAPPAPPATWKE